MTPSCDLLEKAIGLALMAHSGQTDKAGAPYILHPLRLMLAAQGREQQITALLHDVLEDSDISADDLRDAGIPAAVVSALEALTRQLDESYEDFVERLGENPLARAVKLLDLQDNLNVQRLPALKKDDLMRLGRYHRALQYLRSLEDAVADGPDADAV
jgi:hypothetical protein